MASAFKCEKLSLMPVHAEVVISIDSVKFDSFSMSRVANHDYISVADMHNLFVHLYDMTMCSKVECMR